jgi:hypothetical protein
VDFGSRKTPGLISVGLTQMLSQIKLNLTETFQHNYIFERLRFSVDGHSPACYQQAVVS